MSPRYEVVDRPALHDPVLLVALEGWIDAGLGGATALESILGQTETRTVAEFDTDALLDHRARRPTMILDDGVNTELVWPALELRAATDLDDRDLLLLVGAEPDHQWRAVTADVVDLAVEFGVRMVVGLGAYPAGVSHTRPVTVVATANQETLATQVGFVRGRLQLPAGIGAAIERRCADVGIPAIGLWAQVPHYAATMPFPAAGASLLEALHRVAGIRFDLAQLAEDGQRAIRRLDALVADNPEARRLVEQLEAEPDQTVEPGLGTIPTADELLAEVERFLRDQGE